MLLRYKIISKNLWNQEILYMISHNWWVYMKIVIKYWIILVLFFVLYNLIIQYLHIPNIELFFWSFLLVLYIFFVVSFMDSYLDCIVLTKSWIIIYSREWFLRQNTENIQWDSAQSVYDEQVWIIDVVFNKWNIKIKRQDEVYTFDNVSKPSVQANKIIRTREQILSEAWEDVNLDKFDVLVDTLWEVIIDYIRKNRRNL